MRTYSEITINSETFAPIRRVVRHENYRGPVAASDAQQAQTATSKESREAQGEWRGVPELGVEVNSVSGETRPIQGVNPALLTKQLPEDIRPQPNVAGANQQLADRWDALYPGKPMPKEFQLSPARAKAAHHVSSGRESSMDA